MTIDRKPGRRECVGGTPSERARDRMKSRPLEPLLLADGDDPVFIHFSIDPGKLQPFVPFALDLFEGRAVITLVAFAMRRMRFGFGGEWTRWLTAPIADHSFLNLRTYVRDGEERGIHFICEWLNDPVATWLGPLTFGLPYRYGDLDYTIDHERGEYAGSVRAGGKVLEFRAEADHRTDPAPCGRNTVGEFLLERYTAYTRRGLRGFFRVWHEPWPQKPVGELEITGLDLLEDALGGGEWGPHLEYLGANVSPGAKDVWMGRPHLMGKN